MTMWALPGTLADLLHRANCGFCAGLLAIVFLGQLAIVVLRYAFGIGFLELQDALNYSFAMLVVLAIPIGVHADTHVRVDIFRNRQSERGRHSTDAVATFFFLLPVFGVTLWLSLPQILYSWSIAEGSIETGGLPGYFLVKTMFPVAFMLVIIQGLARLLPGRPPRHPDIAGPETRDGR